MTKELIERIRVQMIKNPNSTLWGKDSNKWTNEDRTEFARLEKGLSMDRKKRLSGGISIKVIRISDGYIYKSVRQCMDQNDYHTVEMQKMLKDQIKYKRCEN